MSTGDKGMYHREGGKNNNLYRMAIVDRSNITAAICKIYEKSGQRPRIRRTSEGSM